MPTLNLDLADIASPAEDPDEIAGEDIYLRGGEFAETASGDLATVRGVECAKQSVIRELTTNQGSFPRRQEWGAGLSGLLFKGNSVATRDRVVSRAKTRVQANPRITRTHEVSATAIDQGVRLYVRADAVGGPLEVESIVKPPGVK